MTLSTKTVLPVALFLCAPVSIAQETDSQEEVAAPAPTADILSIRYSGIDSMMTSPKDQAFLGALKMLVTRANEMPAEFGEQNPLPPAALPLISRLVYGQVAMRVGANDPGSSPFPYYVRLEMDAEEGFEPFSVLLTNLLTEVGMPPGEPDMDGYTSLELPLPNRFKDTDGNFVLEIGEVPTMMAKEHPLQLPEGASEQLSASIDYGAFLNLMLSLAGTDPEAAKLGELLESSGAADLKIDWLTGSDETRSYGKYIMRDWLRSEASEVLSRTPLTTDALNRVPADSEWAVMTSLDFSGALAFYGNMLETAIDAEGEYPKLFSEATGIPDFELERDLTRYMGTVQGMYASPSAGGGLYSTVAFCSLTNETAFAASLVRIEDRIMELLGELSRGYVRIHKEESDGVQMTSFQYPGLPIPLNFSYAIADGYFVAGLSSSAVDAAVAHARSGRPGLTDAPGFLEQSATNPTAASSINYLNTPAVLRSGFSAMDMMGTMLANTVRTRAGAEGEARDPGRLVPPLLELEKDVLPMVALSWIDGDNFMTEYRTDKSALVNATAIFPYVSTLYAGSFLFGLAASGAEKSMNNSTGDQFLAQAEIEEIWSALESFAVMNDGKYPETLQELIEKTEAGDQYLVRDELPMDPWGRVYHYDAPSETDNKAHLYTLGADGAWGGNGANLDINRNTEIGPASNPIEELLRELFE